VKINGCVNKYGHSVDREAKEFIEFYAHILLKPLLVVIGMVICMQWLEYAEITYVFYVILSFVLNVLALLVLKMAFEDVFLPIIQHNIAEIRGKTWPKYPVYSPVIDYRRD